MSHTIGSGPIDQQYLAEMKAIARGIDDFLNGGLKEKKVAFILMVFPFGDRTGQRCNYMSNADRNDVVTMLKEQLSYFEGMPDTLSGHA